MKADDHIKAYQERRENVIQWALEIRGLEKSQRTVGDNASRAIVELLSAYLHEKRLVDEGFQLNHRWFKSSSAARRLPEFPKKTQVINSMVKLENNCEKLSYGTPQPPKAVKEVIALFRELERLVEELRI